MGCWGESGIWEWWSKSLKTAGRFWVHIEMFFVLLLYISILC